MDEDDWDSYECGCCKCCGCTCDWDPDDVGDDDYYIGPCSEWVE